MATRWKTCQQQCLQCRASKGEARGTMHSCSSVPNMAADTEMAFMGRCTRVVAARVV